MFCCVVPIQVNACKFLTLPILGYVMMIFKNTFQGISVLLSHILKSKIINYEHKLYGAPFVTPQAWSCGCFIVVYILQSRSEQVVSHFS